MACKLHNVCIDRCGVDHAIERRDEDVYSTVDQEVWWTDGTNMRRGERTDLAKSTRRLEMVKTLQQLQLLRPATSKYCKVRRI